MDIFETETKLRAEFDSDADKARGQYADEVARAEAKLDDALERAQGKFDKAQLEAVTVWNAAREKEVLDGIAAANAAVGLDAAGNTLEAPPVKKKKK